MKLSLSAVLAAFLAVGPAHAAPPLPVFQEETALELGFKLEAPFGTLFKTAAQKPQEEPSTPGVLTFETSEGQKHELAVEVKVRGGTSRKLGECSFPKLTLKFQDPTLLAGTPLEGLKKIKIATHCGEAADTQRTPLGRVANEKANAREALAYRILRKLELPVLLTRSTRITYRDSEAGTELVRGAFFLEDDSQAEKRLELKSVYSVQDPDPEHAPEKKIFRSATQDLSPEDTIAVFLAEALVGNFDWNLKLSDSDPKSSVKNVPLSNLRLMQDAQGKIRPVLEDFDLSESATLLTAKNSPARNQVFDSEPIRAGMIGQLDRAALIYPREQLLAQAKNWLETKREPVLAAIQASGLSPQEIESLTVRAETFFTLLGDAARLLPERIRIEGLKPLKKAKPVSNSNVLCGTNKTFTLPKNLLVRVAKTEGAYSLVALFDPNRLLVGTGACAEVQSQEFWIEPKGL